MRAGGHCVAGCGARGAEVTMVVLSVSVSSMLDETASKRGENSSLGSKRIVPCVAVICGLRDGEGEGALARRQRSLTEAVRKVVVVLNSDLPRLKVVSVELLLEVPDERLLLLLLTGLEAMKDADPLREEAL
jgi:hypothetical protein